MPPPGNNKSAFPQAVGAAAQVLVVVRQFELDDQQGARKGKHGIAEGFQPRNLCGAPGEPSLAFSCDEMAQHGLHCNRKQVLL